ncbi:hypothetical protein [Oleomonas cavernae]|uniref:hypothetical protein n=1 Tax=Oleomonas cavernae TaxID=2320859 RepID=UPI001314DF36|nr:hypothetical protein [Oleomonas cavernae]
MDSTPGALCVPGTKAPPDPRPDEDLPIEIPPPAPDEDNPDQEMPDEYPPEVPPD